MCSYFNSACGLETISNLKQTKFDGSILEGATECNQSHEKDERPAEEGVFGQVFSIPLLLKEILMNLEMPDLLNTSIVSKKLNFFSREVLRERKSCLVIINGRNSCHDLKRLNSLLLNSETVPFFGMSIAVSSGRIQKCARLDNVSELWSNILRKINIQYLSLDFNYYQGCVSLKCIREIICKKAGSLEGLSLKQVPRAYHNFEHTFSNLIRLDLEGQWLPNLRFLELPFQLYENYVAKDLIKSLVEASPKLQEIHGPVNEDCLEFILPLKLSSAVKDFYLRPTINTLKNCLEFSLDNPKLNKFRFSTSNIGEARERIFSRWSESCQNDVATILNQLLESSKESLKKIALDHFDLVLMTTYWNVPTLQKVTHLSLRYCNNVNSEEGLSMFRKIEWPKYFPNLKEVSVTTEAFHLVRDVYLRNGFWENVTKFVCDTVKTFHLARSRNIQVADSNLIQMFHKIFPNVKEVYLVDVHKVISNLKELWTAWRDLEAIYMWVELDNRVVRTVPLCSNLDSVLLGVNETESAYLLKNLEKLEELEIVPTEPSIFNLRKLKTLQIRLFHYNRSCSGSRSASLDSDFLTRLAGQCVFSRLPGLSVEVHRCVCKAKNNCCMALNHLGTFVNFVECDNSTVPEFELF